MSMPMLRRGPSRGFIVIALLAGAAGYVVGRWSMAINSDGDLLKPAKRYIKRDESLQSNASEKRPTDLAASSGFGAGHNERQWKTYAAELERLAMTQPARALQLALAEHNLSLRAQLRCAVLRGWAATDPDAAAEWALNLSEAERGSSIEAVLSGACTKPAQAAELAARICARDPARAAEYGQVLIDALSEVGAFDVAVKYVAGSPSSPQQLEAMNKAFALWGVYDPDGASAFLNQVADASLREEAFRGFAIGWAQADPAALARYAVGLPPGERRAQAFANALPRWLEADPAAATLWIQEFGTDPHPDFDPAVLAVTANAAITARRPDLAVGLAESITDPQLRTNTLRTLALKWAENDVAAARRYVEGSHMFTTEERALLLAEVIAEAK